MRLEVTRRTDLATRALVQLVPAGRRLKGAELAERLGASPGFLSQAMTPLVGKGWVSSEPGPAGGYVLVVDPSEVNLLQVIEAVEGPTDVGRCVLEGRECAEENPCALHVPWSRARGQFLTDLEATSIASVAGLERSQSTI
jgi:Rrf2 family protein